MRDAIRGVLAGLALVLVAGAIADRAGWIAVTVPRPGGHGAWLVARASGVTAFIALGLEVILGLMTSTRLTSSWLPRALRIDLHRWLSPLVLALVAGHAAVLLADDHVRLDAIDVLVPLAATTRSVGVGLGIVALYLTVVVHVSFALRRRLGTTTWRRLHYLSFAGFVAAAAQALVAGSDAGHPWVIALAAIPLAATAALLVIRVAGALELPQRVKPPG
jgi:predicted ferric reductase